MRLELARLIAALLIFLKFHCSLQLNKILPKCLYFQSKEMYQSENSENKGICFPCHDVGGKSSQVGWVWCSRNYLAGLEGTWKPRPG